MRIAVIAGLLLLALGIIPGCNGTAVPHCDWRTEWRGGCQQSGGEASGDHAGSGDDGHGGGMAGTE